MSGTAIEVDGLSKQFADGGRAVSQLSFEVAFGRVTGFLGPNGAGKTTTLRILLGLISSSGGSATFGGLRYDQLTDPVRHVGAVLEATSFHPGRRATDHLRVVTTACGLPTSRVAEVLDAVGLTEAAQRKVGKFSLGMRQRLQLAVALIGEPDVLVLDEPSNGLDPHGIQWLRTLVRRQAAEGRAVLISSHLLAEMEETIDDVVIVSRGRLVAYSALADLAASTTRSGVRVTTRDTAGLGAALATTTVAWDQTASDVIDVHGVDASWLTAFASEHNVTFDEITRRRCSLENVFLQLTRETEPSTATPPASRRRATTGDQS